jgi:pimeloyl-ACP methyl ester carboxylesterase
MGTVKISVLVLLGLASGAAMAAVNCDHKFPIGSSYVPYCSNDKNGPAVFVIHGTNRNAGDYLDYLDDLDTLVIAPYFQEAGPGLYWSSGWKSGDQSKDFERVSSFEVVDRMVEMFHGVTIVGHSAGGQFVTRYAAGTRLQGLTFIVANPGSYLYLDTTRPLSGDCADFNEYKYGLEHLNSYMSAGVSRDYPERAVIYLLGSDDTKIDANLDTSCEANRQGLNRYDRGLRFYEHLNRHYGRPVHRLAVVPGVGHSPSKMLDAARPFLAAALNSQGTGTASGPVLSTVAPGVTESTAPVRKRQRRRSRL